MSYLSNNFNVVESVQVKSREPVNDSLGSHQELIRLTEYAIYRADEISKDIQSLINTLNLLTATFSKA